MLWAELMHLGNYFEQAFMIILVAYNTLVRADALLIILSAGPRHFCLCMDGNTMARAILLIILVRTYAFLKIFWAWL